MRASLVITILLALVFAGCIGGDDEPGPAGDGEDKEPVVTEETGAIHGQVVDSDFEPVVGAEVILLDSANNYVDERISREEGAFVINNLEPGQYRVYAAAGCCEEVVQSALVAAGEQTEVNFQLERIPVPETFVYRDGHWVGVTSCSISYPSGDTPANCPGVADPNKDDVLDIEVPPEVRSIVVAMVWDQALTNTEERMRLVMYTRPTDDPDSRWISQVRNNDGSPIEFVYLFPQRDVAWDVQFRVWVGSGTTPISNFGLAYQQQFELYYHLYYGESAPADASALPDF